MAANEKILVGLDIGTTKICALVGKKNDQGKMEIMAYGQAVSDGVWRGEVANIDKTVDSILKAVKDLDKQSTTSISHVHVGIAGQHIRSMQHRGILTRQETETEISKEDVKNLIRDMHKLAMSPGERIIHVLPQEFYVDNVMAKSDPIGMCGNRLEANFHIITGRVAAAQNIQRCVEKSNLEMDGLILEPLASAAAVLDEDEKEAGVALVDIGGGTTDLAIFQDGIIRHTCVIPFGGNIITDDIKEGCKIMRAQAEQLKVKFGNALSIDTKENQVISIPGLKGRPPKEISMRNLASIIQARMEEIFEQVYFEIKASGYLNKLNGGIVLTGGGSQLKSIKQLVEYVTGLEARIGHPIEHLAKGYNPELAHPKFATGIGLLVKAFEDEDSKSQRIKVDTFDSTVKPTVKHVETMEEEEDVIKEAKSNKVTNWWKDMVKKVPDWLMDENDNDFKD